MNIERVEQHQPDAEKMSLLAGIHRNINLHDVLFAQHGQMTARGRAVLAVLPLRDASGTSLSEAHNLSHLAVEQALQKAFFKPHEASFSFQVASQGAPPTAE
jgi:hypothetical protein